MFDSFYTVPFFILDTQVMTRKVAYVSFVAIAAAFFLGAAGTAQAELIFSENFNSYTGNQNNTQYQTGLKVAFAGVLSGWSKSGQGVIHAVDLANLGGQSNPSNWAIMFYQDNVITKTVGVAANDLGKSYEVKFDYGTAVYANSNQRTTTNDSLLVEVLRLDNTTLASGTYAPGAWDTAGNRNLDAGLTGTLSYTGDGTGVVRLRIGPTPPLTSGRFEGAIDNLSVSQVPEPSGSILLVTGLLALLAYAWKDSPVNGTTATDFRPMSGSGASGGAARASGAGFSKRTAPRALQRKLLPHPR